MKRIDRLRKNDIGYLKEIARIQHIVDLQMQKNSGHSLLLYPAGEHTRMLLECIDLSGYTVFVCDKNELIQGNSINGFVIEQLSKHIVDSVDLIILSTRKLEKEIRQEFVDKGITKPIISLYADDQATEFYYLEREMDIDKMDNIYSSPKELTNKFESSYKYDAWQDEKWGEIYDKAVDRHFFGNIEKNLYLEFVKPNDKVLDFAAGTGRLALEIAKVTQDVIAVDVSESMLSQIKKKNTQIKTVLVEKGTKLPFADDTFDVIVSCDAMIHFCNWKEFLEEHTRVLKPGGYIVYNMINSDSMNHISSNSYKTGSYIATEGDYYSTINRNLLNLACEEIGNIELVEMKPYFWLWQNPTLYGRFTRYEIELLTKMYICLCSNPSQMKLVKEVETMLTSLPEDVVPKNLCVFRKMK